MAEANTVQVPTDAQCAFCLHKKPIEEFKGLPCAHIFCMKCLTKYYKVHNVVRCPLCREVYDVTVNSLPSAHQVLAVDNSILCEVCTKTGVDNRPALSYCTVCNKLYCTEHLKAHDILLEEHPKINIDAYKGRHKKLEVRMCTTHEDLPYVMGCRNCHTPLCVECISVSNTCSDGSAHQLLTLDKLVTELIAVDKIQIREEKLSDLFKQTTNIISDFEEETKQLLKILHKQCDLQPEEIQIKYKKVEEEFLNSRTNTETRMTEFLEEVVGVRWSKLYMSRLKMEAHLTSNHQVDILNGYREMKEQIQNLLSEEIPKLYLTDMKTLAVTDKEREEEVKVVPNGDGCISLDRGLSMSPALPMSMTLLRTVNVSSLCYSVCHHKGMTYAGLWNGGVARVDGNNQLTKSFIRLSGYVYSVTVYGYRIYTLVYYSKDSWTVNVHDLTGKAIHSWPHSDINSHTNNQLAVFDQRIIIPDRANKTLVIYSLTGEIIKALPCPLLTVDYTAVCVVDSQCVIVSARKSSKVFKIDTSTGEVKWTATCVDYPRGVTNYRSTYVLVVDLYRNIVILRERTGKFVSKIKESTIGTGCSIFDLHISGNILIIPLYEGKLLFYQLNCVSFTDITA